MSGRPAPERLASVRLVVFDVDGVLTDGRLGVTSDGETEHRFHVRDGLAFVEASRASLQIAIISGRKSASVGRRLRELRVSEIYQGVGDKAGCIRALCDRLGAALPETAFVGDDINDLPAMRVVGLPIGVADAVPEVTTYLAQAGGWVLSTPGGAGAAREVLQAVLTAQGRWIESVGKQP